MERRRASARDASPARPGSSGSSGSIKCLIVADDSILGAVDARILARAGMLTKHVRTLREGLTEAVSRVWDVLLLDFDLPDGDGVELARYATHLEPRPAILITSGQPALLARRHSLELEMPFVPRAVLAKNLVAWVCASVIQDAKLAPADTANRHRARAQNSPSTRVRPSPARGAQNKLSDRESTVFELLRAGRAPKEIACDLGVSHVTVRTHARNAYQKLGASNLREALAILRGGEQEAAGSTFVDIPAFEDSK